MLYVPCPTCKEKICYVKEQTGQPALCPGCGRQVVLRQTSAQVAGALFGLFVAGLSLAGLAVSGLFGGLTIWATHGVGAMAFGVLALIFGMRIRDFLFILAVYPWFVVLMRMAAR